MFLVEAEAISDALGFSAKKGWMVGLQVVSLIYSIALKIIFTKFPLCIHMPA